MKLRNGFVSNSSSSSFILDKHMLTDEQIDKILSQDRKEIGDGTGSECWSIRDDNEQIVGSTIMDNGYLYQMIKKMNPPLQAIVEWEHDQ
jgi:hypothetical protein